MSCNNTNNKFNTDLYLDMMLASNGNVKLMSRPHTSCPAGYMSFGYVDNFDNGQLNICGRVEYDYPPQLNYRR